MQRAGAVGAGMACSTLELQTSLNPADYVYDLTALTVAQAESLAAQAKQMQPGVVKVDLDVDGYAGYGLGTGEQTCASRRRHAFDGPSHAGRTCRVCFSIGCRERGSWIGRAISSAQYRAQQLRSRTPPPPPPA